MSKRPASSAAGAIMKRPARDPIARDCGLVASALMEAEKLPEATRKMLSAELNNIFVVKEERHAFQDKVIGMIKETLDGIEAGFKESIAAADAKVASADTEKASRDEALANAKAVHEQKVAAVGSCKENLSNAASECKAANTALKEAEAAQKSGDAELLLAATKKEKIETFTKETLAKLKETNEGGTKTFEKSCKEFGIDAGEIKALSSALAKDPAIRGTFDAMVVKKLEEDLDKMVSGLSEKLASGEPAKQERASAVDAAKARKDAADAAKESAEKALSDAEAAEKESKAAAKDAQASVDKFMPEMQEIADARDDATTALSDFEAGAKTAFAQLESRSSTPPPEPEPEAAEAPAADAPQA